MVFHTFNDTIIQLVDQNCGTVQIKKSHEIVSEKWQQALQRLFYTLWTLKHRLAVMFVEKQSLQISDRPSFGLVCIRTLQYWHIAFLQVSFLHPVSGLHHSQNNDQTNLTKRRGHISILRLAKTTCICDFAVLSNKILSKFLELCYISSHGYIVDIHKKYDTKLMRKSEVG